MDRKQEIQNQIAELQRELAKEIGSLSLELLTDTGFSCGIVVRSLDDIDIIDGLYGCHELDLTTTASIVVTCREARYHQTFHVTKNVSYTITPF